MKADGASTHFVAFQGFDVDRATFHCLKVDQSGQIADANIKLVEDHVREDLAFGSFRVAKAFRNRPLSRLLERTEGA